LRELGHEAIAMDLHMDRPDRGLEACAWTVADALDGVERPVLVGHSISGTFLPLAAADADAALMIFLCAMVPVEGRSLGDQLADDPSMVAFPYAMIADEHGRTLPTADVARSMYYPDCTDDDVAWAVPRLVPQAATVRLEPFPAGRWPEHIPAEYIVSRDDTVVLPTWSRRVARERLHVDAVELPGAHSPFLTRPRELAELLVRLADRHTASR
jgi:pimeloyl-ACP methyl ester carboxylesterase